MPQTVQEGTPSTTQSAIDMSTVDMGVFTATFTAILVAVIPVSLTIVAGKKGYKWLKSMLNKA